MKNLPKEFASIRRGAALRLLQMHFEAGVGHIGGNLSCLDSLLGLYHGAELSRDSIVLSKGHAAGALYICLWSLGLLREEELRTFHKDGSHLAGHPAPCWLDAIPLATGSLGHGLSISAGMALAKKLRGEAGEIYCLTSDGEWQEGSTWEALIFACHHRLQNLTVLVDGNGLQGFGSTGEVASMSDLAHKIRAFPVTLTELDGHDPAALIEACRRPTEGPRVLFLRTVKGKGVSFMENRMEWHYLPLNREQYEAARREVEAHA